MASEFRQGDSVFFVFKNGVSLLDSQRHPRMYKTMAQLLAKCPDIKLGNVQIVEYAPVKKE